MTTKLQSNPTPAVFAQAWAKTLEQSVRGLGGADQKITWAEAKTAIAEGKIPRHLADNVTNFFEKSGRTTSGEGVSPQQLVASALAYAQRAAESAAGPDGRLSKADAQKLPTDLRADYTALITGGVPPTKQQALAAALNELLGKGGSGFTQEIPASAYADGSVPSAVQAEIENTGAKDPDATYTAFFVYGDVDQKKVIGWALRRESETGAVSASILDRNGAPQLEG